MAKGNLPACLEVTLVYEGGFTENPKDPGNWTGGKIGAGKLRGTKYGIAAASYPLLNIKNLTLETAREIYSSRYWTPISGEALPFGLDLATFDASVNSGVGRGAKWLQSVVGATPDGRIGSDTLKAVAPADVRVAIQAMCAKRLGFMRSLKIWETFKRGWSRRVADVEVRAVAMWLKLGAGLSPAKQAEALQAEADKATDKSKAQDKGSAGAGAGGVAVGGGDAVMNGGVNWLLIVGMIVAVAVVSGVLLVKARQNRDRAEAYKAVAATV